MTEDSPVPMESLNDWLSNGAPDSRAQSGPENYIADDPLLDAVRTAMFLGQPLLLTGEPGCGKTELADHIAWRLGLGRRIGQDALGRPAFEYALRFDTKSETRARDLFYSIDLVERFHAAHVEKDRAALNSLDYIRFQALGRALLYANPVDDLARRLLPAQAHPGQPCRSVVLIDEIDKAPSDVPNDLLMEMENLRFFISELDRLVTAPPRLRPVVIITSNSEKPLSDAFLRRCIYYHVPFPGRDNLKKILMARTDIDVDAPMLGEAVELFEELRKQPLQKKPATAELLGFVQALRIAGCAPGDSIRSISSWRAILFATLLKNRADQRLVTAAFPA